MKAEELMEKIMEEAPSVVIDGNTYYVVEGDLKVPEDQLQTYVEDLLRIISPEVRGPATVERLVVATLPDGRMMRWSLPVRLTWAIDENSFKDHPDWRAQAEEICAAATEEWNQAATQEGVADRIGFSPAAAGETPVFKFAFDSFTGKPGLLALAFFPNDAPAHRVVFIGPGTFAPGIPYDQVGVIRHELGHVLGFRHEHIRPEAQEGMTQAEKVRMEKWVTGGIGGEELTNYDRQSVMHYPLNGHGTLEFEISELDRKGFGMLYRMPSNPKNIAEFPI